MGKVLQLKNPMNVEDSQSETNVGSNPTIDNMMAEIITENPNGASKTPHQKNCVIF
jgi:hypothetical protein